MKRYIRASMSVGLPDWASRALKSSRYGDDLGNKLVKRYNIALDKVQTLDHEPDGRSLVMYLMPKYPGDEVMNITFVYIPGVNDDAEMQINGRWRKAGSVAKSKLPEMALDVAWIDLDDPNNTFAPKNKYQDPRYSYRYNSKGDYAGQYKITNYNYDTHEREDVGWSKSGMTPSNESRARDKSGYKVPSPEEMIQRFYTKFPEKITDKIDEVYAQIKDMQSVLVDADFNSPTRYSSKYRNAYTRFGDAVDEYRQLLNSFRKSDSSDRKYNRFYNSFASQISSIKRNLADVADYLNEIEND